MRQPVALGYVSLMRRGCGEGAPLRAPFAAILTAAEVLGGWSKCRSEASQWIWMVARVVIAKGDEI